MTSSIPQQVIVDEALAALIEAQKTRIQKLEGELEHAITKWQEAEHYRCFIGETRLMGVMLLSYSDLGLSAFHAEMDRSMPPQVAKMLKDKTRCLDRLPLDKETREYLRAVLSRASEQAP